MRIVRGAASRVGAAVVVGGLVLSSCGAQPGADPVEGRTEVGTLTPMPSAGGTSGTGTFTPLPVEGGWGPTADEITRARGMVDDLTLSERAGQVIMARYQGTDAPTGLVNGLHLGGVVAFGHNIVDADQVRRSNRALQASARAAGRRWPVLVGVDQEGGPVARVTSGVTGFPAFMTAGAADDTALTRQAYAASGGELADLGFTVDFAPDADVTRGPRDPTIGSRSAGSRPSLVADQSVAALRGFASSGVLPVLKHFPGHGSVTSDSHQGLPVQRKSRAELTRSDLVPFDAGIAAGASAVMVAHLDVRSIDPGVPSSLSRKVVTGLLRDRMGFSGLAVTDALDMHAVADRFGSAGAAVRALRAGEDVLLLPPRPRAARDGIVAAVRSGRLSQARLDQAATRVVAYLLHQKKAGRHTRTPGSSAAVSHRLSAAGLTVVAGPCSGRLVGRRVHVTGDPIAVGRFKEAAHDAGLSVRRRGTTVRLLGAGSGPARGAVVVATDTPYVLGRSGATRAKIATYGTTAGAMRSLVDVLLGRAAAPGRLPVGVAGVPRTGC